MKVIGWFFAGIVPAYLATCAGISASRSHAYEAINHGDSREAVIAAFGEPDGIDFPTGKPFPGYATGLCDACSERLWFRNRLSLAGEAWSVEIGHDGRVIDKYRWMSP